MVTVAVVVVNLIVFARESMLSSDAFPAFLATWGLVPARETAARSVFVVVLFGLTSMFVHGGWAHVLGNMLYLWVFGRGLESRIGQVRFFAIYFAAGLVASQAQAWLDPYSTTPIVGASGAIAGVLGAYFVVSPRAWVTVMLPIWFVPLFFEVPAVLFLGLWFVIQFLDGVHALTTQTSGGIAWWAHVAGFLAGALFVRILGVPPPPEPETPGAWSARFGRGRRARTDENSRPGAPFSGV
jgi:membrane associated rhomboid family serine protease